mgnify:CR=1 FL=1
MLFNYILSNKKFQSLFLGSLEMQKFNFLDLLIENLENEDFYGGSYMNKYDK